MPMAQPPCNPVFYVQNTGNSRGKVIIPKILILPGERREIPRRINEGVDISTKLSINAGP